MNTIVAVGAGGALGALGRFWMASAVYALLGRGFPYGTLAVNVVGSAVFGFLYVLLLERYSSAPEWRAFLLIGFLGSFTTFSTFSMETLNLLQQGAYLKSASNIVLSVLVCIGAAWLGVILGRQV